MCIVLIFSILPLYISSCKNFLNGAETVQQIEEAIAYANATPSRILVISDSDEGYIRKPAEGEVTKKPTDSFEIKFEVAQDHTFVRWEACSVNLPQDESITDYIEFEDPTNPETTVKFKKSLSDIVIKANCPSLPYTEVAISGNNGTFSPVTGSYTCTQGYTYPISFDPNTDYEFIRWKIYDSKTGAEIPNGKYITIKNPEEAVTSYSLESVPENCETVLTVSPMVILRAQIISWSPLGSGMFKDSSIQVLFDTEMNPLSIYYTKAEMDAMQAQDATIVPLFENGNIDSEGNQLYYGYIQGGQKYFKNIMITNKKTGENITKCFNAPVFENASTLTIPTNNDEYLDDYTQVIVTIGDAMYFTSHGKNIAMGGIKKWLYQVSNTTDNQPLALEKTSGTVNFSMELNDSKVKNPAKLANFSINQTTGTGISNLEGFYVNNSFANAALNLRFKVLESGMGSGPKDFFTIYYRKAYDEDYKSTGASFTTQTVDYNSVTSEEAFFEGSVVLKNLKTINDGVYEMYFSFDDKSGNRLYYPSNTSSATSKYYFVKDRNIPTISNLKISSNNSTDYNLSWDCPLDIKTSTVSIKKNGGTATTQSTSRGTHTVSGIEKNIKYDIELSVTDYAGNTQTATVPKFLTGLEISGTQSFGEVGVFFTGDTVDKYGLSVKKYYSDKSSVDISSSYTIPNKDDYTTKSTTVSGSCTEGNISKSISKTYSYYTVKADALTPSPVRIDYSGSVSGIFYKFGDYPQTLSKISNYTSSAVYKGWYLGKDGYFYEYATEEGFNSNYCYSDETTKVGTGGTNKKYFKVEPVVWRKLTDNYVIRNSSGKYESTGKALLYAEKILTAINFLEKLPSNGTRTVDGNNKVFVANYKYSSLRAYFNNLYFEDTSSNHCSTTDWGTNGFLKKAFTSTAQGKIATTTVDNSPESTMLFDNPKSYNNGVNNNATCGYTYDKIFALSWWELSNPNYKFLQGKGADNARVRWTSDYALAKGAYKKKPAEQSGGFYWTRSPDEDEGWSVRDVDWDGHNNDERNLKSISKNEAGAVPALTISNSYLP